MNSITNRDGRDDHGDARGDHGGHDDHGDGRDGARGGGRGGDRGGVRDGDRVHAQIQRTGDLARPRQVPPSRQGLRRPMSEYPESRNIQKIRRKKKLSKKKKISK